MTGRAAGIGVSTTLAFTGSYNWLLHVVLTTLAPEFF